MNCMRRLRSCSGERPGLQSAQFRPSPEQWAAFGRSLDEIDIWSWRSEYPNPGILDGTQWGLDIEYPDRSVHWHGITITLGQAERPTEDWRACPARSSVELDTSRTQNSNLYSGA
jgi:hypothetical protein